MIYIVGDMRISAGQNRPPHRSAVLAFRHLTFDTKDVEGEERPEREEDFIYA